jgi:glycosyltransferase involved in cell wall biosynthesis
MTGEPQSRPRVGLVIPALDEEKALPLVLAELPSGLFDVVVVVDNGSRDRTADVARAAGAHVVREARRGYGRACLTGLAALFGEHEDPRANVERPLGPRDVVAFVDGDHSDHPEDLARVVAPILAGDADLVIGSRVLGGASMKAMLPQAWLGNRFACALMRLCFGASYTDLGPMRAIRADSLRSLSMRDPGFGWTVEMQLKAHSLRLRTREVAVRYRPRIGQSKITGTVGGTMRAALKILGWILAWRLRLPLLRR